MSNSVPNPSLIKLQALVGFHGPDDLQFGPLHRIVTGLSCADLQTQLDLEPSRIDDPDGSGMTPLMWAAYRGSYTYLEVLLSQGAQIDLRDSVGRTALTLAIEATSMKCAKALLTAGANPNIADDRGFSPAHKLYFFKSSLDSESMATLLHVRGANLDAKDIDGWTPLHYATDSGSHEAVVALINHGADTNACTDDGITPIGFAVYRRDDKISETLCNSGALPSWNSTPDSIENILHWIATYGSVAVMDVIGNSLIPPLECDVNLPWYCFNTFRENIHFERYNADEEERSAFKRLLEKKAIPVRSAQDLYSQMVIEDTKNQKENPDVEIEDEREEESDEEAGKSDDEDVEDEAFEDAREDFTDLDRPGNLTVSPAESVA